MACLLETHLQFLFFIYDLLLYQFFIYDLLLVLVNDLPMHKILLPWDLLWWAGCPICYT